MFHSQPDSVNQRWIIISLRSGSSFLFQHAVTVFAFLCHFNTKTSRSIKIVTPIALHVSRMALYLCVLLFQNEVAECFAMKWDYTDDAAIQRWERTSWLNSKSWNKISPAVLKWKAILYSTRIRIIEKAAERRHHSNYVTGKDPEQKKKKSSMHRDEDCSLVWI